MAETAQTLIKDILQEAFVQADEQAIESVDFQTALRYLNRYMEQLSSDGIELSWTELVNPSDVATSPQGATLGIIYNTALQLCSSYDINPSPLLINNARESMKVLEKIGTVVLQSNFPSTLPYGAGNNDSGANPPLFYSGCGEDLDTCAE